MLFLPPRRRRRRRRLPTNMVVNATRVVKEVNCYVVILVRLFSIQRV